MEHPVWSFFTRHNGIDLGSEYTISPPHTPQYITRELSIEDRAEYAAILRELGNMPWYVQIIVGQWP